MKAKQKMIGVAILALLLIATIFVASQFFDNGGKTFATQSRSVGVKEQTMPFVKRQLLFFLS